MRTDHPLAVKPRAASARRAAWCGAAALGWACSQDVTLLHPACAGECAANPGEDAGQGRDAAPLPALPPLGRVALVRLPLPELEAPVPGCQLASPVASPGGFIAASGDRVRAFSLQGDLLWDTTLPAPAGQKAFVVATPLLRAGELFIGYHTVSSEAPFDVNQARLSQRVLVLDAASGAPSPDYEPLALEHTFAGNDGASIPFRADRALGRSALVAGSAAGSDRLIVTFGNARDIQPWHGFAFELDLERWRVAGAAAAPSGSLIVTPEAECGPDGRTGSRDRRCGGGLWAPAGPTLVTEGDGFALILAPGNGQLDLGRHDYANTLMRAGPGLDFDPRCGSACDAFDPDAPSAECVQSCRDLFIPRDAPGDPFPLPESGACDGLSLFECWQALDYVGGSTPVQVAFEGRELLVYPAKDGAVYLIDWEHLGRLYDRKQLVSVCGTRADPCRQDWAGMIVTRPTVLDDAGRPLIVVPTFMPDATHPAGVFALGLAQGAGGPRLQVEWQYPAPGSPEARLAFRQHPTRAAVVEVDGTQVVVVVDVQRGGRGRLIALRAHDGAPLGEVELGGPGYRFVEPLVAGANVVVTSCDGDAGPSQLELFQLSRAE